jgi:hypothetical protein
VATTGQVCHLQSRIRAARKPHDLREARLQGIRRPEDARDRVSRAATLIDSLWQPEATPVELAAVFHRRMADMRQVSHR